MKTVIKLILAIALCSLPALAQQPAQIVGHSHTSAATITLTTFPNLSVYITAIDVTNCQGSVVTPAAPTFITTTGINGAPQYMLGSGPAAAGTCSPTSVINFATPLKSQTPGTNVTFVLPAFITNQVASVNVYYYLAP